MRKFTVCMFFTLFAFVSNKNVVAQTKADGITSSLLEINKKGLFKPIVGIELWETYSMGEEKGGIKYDNRSDVYFRRLRFGGSGSPYSWLKYHFQLQIDRLGEDSYASTKGSYTGIGLWDAYITARIFKDSELLNFHAGYYWAAISREYNTSAWSMGSFDRNRANWYMRTFMTGKGNGIESGLGFGGLKNFKGFGFAYRVGTFEPKAYSSAEISSRLYTAHLLLSFGEPEQKAYKYRLSGNHWRKRKGLTLGFGGAKQNKGQLSDGVSFNKSQAYGADLLFNYAGLRIDGEYFKFSRKATALSDYDGTEWHLRVGYSFLVSGKYLEPVLTYDSYEGKGEKALFNHIGDDNTLDVGINWYLNKDKLKVSLHYLVQEGSASANIGDYLGVGCQFRL
ncbi:porin [Plebeiibacterium marinum]|uniref:OprO/OprP family phosphate-selective porin n=1 Tax=Plebeiibacterium marinum TaxID=2992111 RepID=A0AAE3SMX2_9BACT|nr:porin [Plebeiobacterium marinum]MCW3807985.1 OprO/OprP family phosphate-selective porin [Plebeiobacterium marinum]